MGEPVTLHKYAYANVDPANLIDPSGHFASLGESMAALATLAIGVGIAVGQPQIGFSSNSQINTDVGLSSSQTGWLTLLNMSGSPSLSMLVLKREADIDAAQNAGKNRATADVSISERTYGFRRAMIGENQSRVIAAARFYQAITIGFDSPYAYEGQLTPEQIALSMAYNYGWVATVRELNFEIYDIGVDRNRTGPVSPWYTMELMAVRGYEKHFPQYWP